VQGDNIFMLTLLRRYQRFLFIIITIVIVITFSFFGTNSLNSQKVQQKKDEIIARAIDGTAIRKSEIDTMSIFLSSDQIIAETLSQKGIIPNLMNDGVVYKDFVKTGIVQIIVEEHFDDLKNEMQKSFDKMKHYSFYRHPQANFLSAMSVWNKLNPSIIEDWENMKRESSVSKENVDTYLKMYMKQIHFSSDTIKKILLYQQSQYPWMNADQRLLQEDVSLFGFNTIQDWFGQNFVDLISQYIFNVAIIAEKNGYVVTQEEALSSLITNVKEGFVKQSKAKNITQLGSGKELLQHQVRAMGVDQKSVVNTWQKILLFRRYVNDVGNNVYFDELAFNEINTYVNEEAMITRYHLPEYLCLSSFDEFLKLQMYLKCVRPVIANDESFLLDLTDLYYSVEEVEQTYPELVEQKYTLNVAAVTIEEIGLKIGERKMWEWQLKEENWEGLEEEFPKLQNCNSGQRSERFKALESLSKDERMKLDVFSRKMMVKLNTEMIAENLGKIDPYEVEVGIRSKGGTLPFDGIADVEVIKEMLSQAPCKEYGEDITEEQMLSQKKLSYYTEDNNTFYAIEVLKRNEKKQIITFEEAKKNDVIDDILSTTLQKHYVEIRQKHPQHFSTEYNHWKSFSDVESIIALYFFEDVLKAIDNEYNATHEEKVHWNGGDGPLEFYLSEYLSYYITKIKDNLMHDITEDRSAWVVGDETTDRSVNDQWKLKESHEKITRSCEDTWVKDIVYGTDKITWSPTEIMTNGQICFFEVVERNNSSNENTFSMERGRAMLANEAVCNLMKSVVSDIKDKKVIVLPVNRRNRYIREDI
jgi:hypothetical protein